MTAVTSATESVELTQELVRIASENPSGAEDAVSGYVAEWLQKLPHVTVQQYQVEPGRSNVVARLGRGGAADAPAFIAHMDTVPVGDGWTVDPFGGEIRDGKLYGRGSCDMKAGLAAAMVALVNVAQSGASLNRDLLLCATVDEEGLLMKRGVDLVEQGS